MPTWQSEDGSFPLLCQNGVSLSAAGDKSVAVFIVREGDAACDAAWRRADVRVTRLESGWKHVTCSRFTAGMGAVLRFSVI